MLYTREIGQGRPVVMLHGLFGSLENLAGIARPLSEQFHTLSLDLPNHGRSPHVSDCDLGCMARSVRDWLEREQLHQVSLVGHSLGGKVAMELALAEPEMVERLVVLDIAPVSYEARHQQVFAGLTAIDPAHLSTRGEADKILARYVPELPVRTFLLKNLVKAESGFRWRMGLAELERSYPELIRANSEGTFSGPTLFIKGEGSDYLTESARPAITVRFPQAQLKIATGTGHWLHAEKPDLVGRLIRQFLLSSSP